MQIYRLGPVFCSGTCTQTGLSLLPPLEQLELRLPQRTRARSCRRCHGGESWCAVWARPGIKWWASLSATRRPSSRHVRRPMVLLRRGLERARLTRRPLFYVPKEPWCRPVLMRTNRLGHAALASLSFFSVDAAGHGQGEIGLCGGALAPSLAACAMQLHVAQLWELIAKSRKRFRHSGSSDRQGYARSKASNFAVTP